MAQLDTVLVATVGPNGFGLRNCPLFAIPAGSKGYYLPVSIERAQCSEQTCIPWKNARWCARYRCGSPERRCPICILQGRGDASAVVANPAIGLCTAHRDRGVSLVRAHTQGSDVSSLQSFSRNEDSSAVSATAGLPRPVQGSEPAAQARSDEIPISEQSKLKEAKKGSHARRNNREFSRLLVEKRQLAVKERAFIAGLNRFLRKLGLGYVIVPRAS